MSQTGLEAALGDLPRAVPGLCQATLPGSPGRLSPFVCTAPSCLPVWEFPLSQIPRAQHRDPSSSPGDPPGACNGKPRAHCWDFPPKSLIFCLFKLHCDKNKLVSITRTCQACSQNSSPGMELVVQGCPPSCVSLAPQRPGAPSRCRSRDLGTSPHGAPPRLHSMESPCSLSVPGGCWGPTGVDVGAALRGCSRWSSVPCSSASLCCSNSGFPPAAARALGWLNCHGKDKVCVQHSQPSQSPFAPFQG